MSRILITGGSGFLGQNIAPLLARRHQVFASFFRNACRASGENIFRLDVTSYVELVEQFRAIGPELVVHAAAMTNPDECEREPEEAKRLILGGTINVARICAECNCRLIYISTDLVFDGRRGRYTEEDPVCGISVYAGRKIEAEMAVQEIAPSATILRVALLYGQGTAARPGYIELTLRDWRRAQPVTFFTDQYRTPLFAPYVADIVEAIEAHPEFKGVLHAGGGQRLSRCSFAQLLAERVGAPAELVQPGSMWNHKAAAPRGQDCSLISRRLEQELGLRPPTCSEGLDLLVKSGYLKPLQLP